MSEIDFNAHYKVNGWPGVAVYPVEYKKETILDDVEFFDDEIGEWVCADWEPTEIEDESQVYVVMVGDDTRHLVDVDDLVKIEETDFCRECGQIGCGHLVYE